MAAASNGGSRAAAQSIPAALRAVAELCRFRRSRPIASSIVRANSVLLTRLLQEHGTRDAVLLETATLLAAMPWSVFEEVEESMVGVIPALLASIHAAPSELASRALNQMVRKQNIS